MCLLQDIQNQMFYQYYVDTLLDILMSQQKYMAEYNELKLL